MAGDSKEQVVVERWQHGKLVDEHFWHLLSTCTFPCNPVLGLFREQFVGKFSQPGFQHGADDVDVVEIRLFKKIHIQLCTVRLETMDTPL